MRNRGLARSSLLAALALMASACSGGAASTGVSVATETMLATLSATGASTIEAAVTAEPPNPQPAEVADIATPRPAGQPVTDGTRIQVTIGDTVLTGQLWDNVTAQELSLQLPLILSFSDFNNVEKIALLPMELSVDGLPEGDDPLPRDIGYYAPWGNLVFYYGDVGYFNGIVRIGQFDGSVDAIARQTGDFTARIELAP